MIWNFIQRVSGCVSPRFPVNYWNVAQFVSCYAPSGLHLNCWYATIKFVSCCGPSELHLNLLIWNLIQTVSCFGPAGLYLNCWHAAIKKLSRMWVAVCLLGSIWIADMEPWNLIQLVSFCVLLGFIWTADLWLWTSIQRVSCCMPPRLHLNCWHAAIKFLAESELLYASWAPFELLTCHEIPSRKWVGVCFLGSIWIADMPLWNFIQRVSCCMSYGLHLNCWHASIKFHLGGKLLGALGFIWHAPITFHSGGELLGVFWAIFEILTCHHEIPSREWVAMDGLHLNCWHTAIKFHSGSELVCACRAPFELLTCHEISFREWVGVCLGFYLIADIPLWNFIQRVSCCMSYGPFVLLICSYEIPSREWVAVCLGSI